MRVSHLPLVDPGPAGSHDPQRIAVQIINVLAVDGPSDERFVLHRFFHRYAARNRVFARVAAQMRIRSVIGRVNRAGGDADRVQNIAQARAGPVGARNRARRPLIALRRRIVFGATVAAAFDLQVVGVMLEVALQVVDREIARRLRGFAADAQFPFFGIDVFFDGRDAVVAHEHVFGRSDRIVQQMRRRFGVDRAVVQNDKPRFAVGLQIKRSRRIRISGGDEPARHFVGENDRQAQRRAHAGDPRAFEEAAPRGVGLTPEEQAVGALRILAVEFVQAALGARRRFCGGFFHRMSPG